jgi:peptide/nickel transport system substrate-binding protein
MKKALLVTGALLTLSAAGALAATDKNTLVEMTTYDIPTLDPALGYDISAGTVIEEVYETLLTYKGQSLSEFQPVLATSWKPSTNGLSYTFTLRRNVKFHGGETMTCADAEYSFERALVTNNSASWVWFLAEPLLGSGSNAKDDKNITYAKIDKAVECNPQGQLVFTLVQKDPAMLVKLAFYGAAVVNKAWAVKNGEWSGTASDFAAWAGKDLTTSYLHKTMNGTGAYQLVSRTANQTVFKAFDGYWGGKPKLENVVLQKVDDQATRILAIQRGDADVIGVGDRASLTQLRGARGVKIVDDLPNLNSPTIIINQNIKDPKALGSGKLDGNGIPANFLSDVHMRRCLAYSFDAKTYTQQVQGGKGLLRTSVIPDRIFGYDPTVPVYNYDPEKAEKECKLAWNGQVWKNGFVLPIKYRANSTASQASVEILKRNIEALNPKFRVNLEAQAWTDLLADSRKGNTPLLRITWVMDYADPDNFVYPYLHPQGTYGPRMNYNDPVMVRLVEQARTTTGAAARKQLYRLIAQRAYDMVPVINVPADVGWWVMREELRGWEENYNVMINDGALWKNLYK